MITNSNAILQNLKSLGYKVEFQEETDQVYYLIAHEGKSIPIFIKSISDGMVVQVVAFYPFKSEVNAHPDLARFLHLMNKDIDMPGYGMDENSRAVFYRLSIPTFEKKLKISLLTTYLNTIEKVSRDTMNSIAPIANGSITFKELIDKLQ